MIEKQQIACTCISYSGIPFLHADECGNLYQREHFENRRTYPARKIKITVNGSSKRIKFKGRVYYFSRLRQLAFSEKNEINFGSYPSILPF